jgi:hypothetical protein
MDVDVSDSLLVDELADLLRRYGYAIVRTGLNRLHVGLGASQRGAVQVLGSAELELALYLRAWEARHPGVQAARVNGHLR